MVQMLTTTLKTASFGPTEDIIGAMACRKGSYVPTCMVRSVRGAVRTMLTSILAASKQLHFSYRFNIRSMTSHRNR